MKGTILNSLEQLVTEKHSRDHWRKILVAAGLNEMTMFSAMADVDDGKVLQMVGATCQVLGIELKDFMRVWGDFWVGTWVPKLYGSYLHGVTGARDYFLRLDSIHESVTRNIPNARPPRFAYEWKSDRVLRMTYSSQRGLIDLMVEWAGAVGRHFKEQIVVTKVPPDKLDIQFPTAARPTSG
jgi:hypothetical protein